jgi:mannose-6-phosphate isomerase-like protein (cupin superfamily)
MEKYTALNIYRFAEENPIDRKLGFSRKEAAFGKNACVDLIQMAPGTHFGAHYHSISDEIDFVIRGQANMTANGEVRPIKSGDLIYIPPSTIHSFDAIGDEDLRVLVIYSPPLDEKDRTFV